MQLHGKYRAHRLYGESRSARVWAAERIEDGAKVVIKEPLGASPAQRQARCENELRILARVDSPHVVRPLEVVGRYASASLVIEEIERAGVLRDCLAAGPVSVALCLDYACQLQSALAAIHAAGIVHRDIHPGNILVGETGHLTVIDFATATQLRWVDDSGLSARELVGTLHYIAPEQSGRSGAGVDHRADYYALGATLYELLAGAPPFSDLGDPVELIHAHFARTPVAIDRRRPEVPSAFAAVIAKLLAKSPEERYQGACGLADDLRYCVDQFEGKVTVEADSPFQVGATDRAEGLLFGERLYGRDDVLDQLERTFSRVCGGDCELVWLVGESGTGKSAVVERLVHRLRHPGATYARGKFDALAVNRPFHGLLEAIAMYCTQLAALEPRLARQRAAAMRERVGDHAGMIVELVPESQWLFGDVHSPPLYEATAARDRAEIALCRFFSAAAFADHPLLLVLDDVQWVDRATVSCLTRLLSEDSCAHLLVVAAHRPLAGNGELQAWSLLDGASREVGIAVQTVRLGPLKRRDILAMLEKVAPGLADAPALAEVVRTRTGGNPMLAREYLIALHTQGILAWSHEARAWSCSSEAAAIAVSPGDAVELVLKRFSRLPQATQRVLAKGAAFGHEFYAADLCALVEESPQAIHDVLWPALTAGFVLGSKAARVEVLACGPENEALHEVGYSFAHDQVQEAAYAQLGANTGQIHAEIAALFAGRAWPCVDVLRAADQIRATGNALPTELANFARKVLVAAGERALASGAFDQADEYLAHTSSLDRLATGDDIDTRLRFRAQLMRCQCAGGRGDFALAIGMAQALIAQAPSRALLLTLHHSIVMFEYSARHLDDAYRSWHEACAALELDADPQPSTSKAMWRLWRIRRRINSMGDVAIAQLPELEDEVAIAEQELIMAGLAPAYESGHSQSFLCATLRVLEQCLNRGRSGPGMRALMLFAMFESMFFRRHDRARALSKMAMLGLSNLRNAKGRCTAYASHAMFISHWVAPKHETLAAYREAIALAEVEGDRFLPGASWCMLSHCIFLVGERIDNCHEPAEHWRVFAASSGDPGADCFKGLLSRLQRSGLGRHPHMEVGLRATGGTQQVYAYVHEIFIGLLWGSPRELPSALERLQPLSSSVSAAFAQAMLAPLCPAAACYLMLRSSGEDRRTWRARGKRSTRSAARAMTAWLEHNPDFARAPVQLAEGISAILRGRHDRAIAQLQACMATSVAGGMPQLACLAARMLAEYHRDARAYSELASALSRARQFASLWGCSALARRLEIDLELAAGEFGLSVENFARTSLPLPQSPASQPETVLANTARSTVVSGTIGQRATAIEDAATFDLGALFEVSRSLSSERNHAENSATLLRSLVANCGATRACLVRVEIAPSLCWTIETESRVADGRVEVIAGSDREIPVAALIPESVVTRSIHTRTRVSIGNLDDDPVHADDPYVRAHTPKSILCVPLLQKGVVAFVVYLENHNLHDAFAESRVRVAEILGAEFVLSVESSNLVSRLERRGDELARELEALRVADETKSQFLATLSQELRTPLHGIMGSVAVLADTGMFADHEEWLKIIQNSGDRLTALIGRVLDFSDLQRGGSCLELARVELDRFLFGCMSSARASAEIKHIDFRIEPSTLPSDCLILDPHALARSLRHVLENAVACTDVGEVGIRVELSERVEDFVSTWLCIEVWDTGVGMSSELLDALAGPHALDAGRLGGLSDGVRGGLGLALTKRLVDSMAGELLFQCRATGGTEVRIEIPVERAEPLELPPELHANALSPRATSSKITGLVVLGEGGDRGFGKVQLVHGLAQVDVQAQVVAMGRGPLESALAEPGVSLIIVDELLAREQLDFVLAETRASEHANVPVIAWVSSVDDQAREKWRGLGCRDLLQKPLQNRALAELLVRLGLSERTGGFGRAA